MFYNSINVFIMGEFVVSPILMLAADRSAMFTATVVIAGISIVVGVLLLLIFIFYLFGKIVPVIEKKSKASEEKKAKRKAARAAKKAAKKAARSGGNITETETVSAPAAPPVQKSPVPAPASAPVVQSGISGEVVAAITAAVVATEGSGAVIRSIKKKNVGGRNPWSAAATFDNTRPF